MSWYYEYAPNVYSRTGLMKPEEEFQGLIGFRSAYGFSKETADVIIQQGNSKGLKRFPQFTDKLLLDFDNGDRAMLDGVKWARENGLHYQLFFSGKKGYHLEIETVPMEGVWTAFSQKTFVEKSGLEADLSIFRASSLYRLPGTPHQETGIEKELVEEWGQCTLDIPYQLPPEAIPEPFQFSDFESAIWQLHQAVAQSPGLGNRHMTLWKLAMKLREAGLSKDASEEILCLLNQSWGPDAKELPEVIRALNGAWS